MATIKSYSDLQQSKKLAEILPLESADMYFPNRIDIKYQGALPIEYKHGNPLLSQEIAAWSLAALIGVLPYGYSSILTKCFDGKDYYCNLDGKHIETMADNPVDACVEMIIKLHELNLL